MSVKKLNELEKRLDEVKLKLILHPMKFDIDVYIHSKYYNILYKEEERGDKSFGYFFEEKHLHIYLDLLHKLYKVDKIWYAVSVSKILFISTVSPDDEVFEEYIGEQEIDGYDIEILTNNK